MYFLPHLFDAYDFKQKLFMDEFNIIFPEVTNSPQDFSEEFKEFAETFVQMDDKEMPICIYMIEYVNIHEHMYFTVFYVPKRPLFSF